PDEALSDVDLKLKTQHLLALVGKVADASRQHEIAYENSVCCRLLARTDRISARGKKLVVESSPWPIRCRGPCRLQPGSVLARSGMCGIRSARSNLPPWLRRPWQSHPALSGD